MICFADFYCHMSVPGKRTSRENEYIKSDRDTEFILLDGVTYTISAIVFRNNELATVSMNMLPPKEYVPGPVTVNGTVSHVDSCPSGYFNGAEHHYSKGRDYITVDCDDMRPTVWFPEGETALVLTA